MTIIVCFLRLQLHFFYPIPIYLLKSLRFRANIYKLISLKSRTSYHTSVKECFVLVTRVAVAYVQQIHNCRGTVFQ